METNHLWLSHVQYARRKIKRQIPPAVLLSSSCKIFALLSFFLCYSLIFSINFPFVVAKFLIGSFIFLLSNKNFSGWSTYVVNFTFLVWFGVSFADVFPDNPFSFEVGFLAELLNLEPELKLDLCVAPVLPCPVKFTVLPKSGISKFLSYNWVNSKFVNKLTILAFSYPFLYTLWSPSKWSSKNSKFLITCRWISLLFHGFLVNYWTLAVNYAGT